MGLSLCGKNGMKGVVNPFAPLEESSNGRMKVRLRKGGNIDRTITTTTSQSIKNGKLRER